MSAKVRRRGNRHAQRRPVYLCTQCRPGPTQDHRLCVDELRIDKSMRLCDCKHEAEVKSLASSSHQRALEAPEVLVAVRGSAYPKEADGAS